MLQLDAMYKLQKETVENMKEIDLCLGNVEKKDIVKKVEEYMKKKSKRKYRNY